MSLLVSSKSFVPPRYLPFVSLTFAPQGASPALHLQMTRTVYVRPKALFIVFGISMCLILWMTFKGFKKLPMEMRRLRTERDEFFLEGKPFRILSGSIHYFRVVPEYWRDRLIKLKSMGLNTVETYVPWNLHEEVKGHLNLKGILDVVHFIKTAQEVGLYVIIRPGPYICAEWELGGLPSWLLRDPEMKLRSMYPGYIDAVNAYFNKILPIFVPLQFTHGGPIIAFQVENEYGSFGPNLSALYMLHLKNLFLRNGLEELFFTSDGIRHMKAKYFADLPGVLKTANFQINETRKLADLKQLQPDKPMMVAEFWPGWFDHWGEPHHEMEIEKVVDRVSNILEAGASINFFMFHGGTNFGFMNGANGNREIYQPTVTSYDYDAPLSEAGDITNKYKALRNVLAKYSPDARGSLPFDEKHERATYEDVEMEYALPLSHFLLFFGPPVESEAVVPMEQLPINNNCGQSYGFIVYQAELNNVPTEIVIRNISDRAQVFLDFVLIQTIDAMKKDEHFIDNKKLWEVKIVFNGQKKSKETVQLDILVENMGRVNFGLGINKQRKGILGGVKIDGKEHTKWNIYPMEFKPPFFDTLRKQAEWRKIAKESLPSVPALYKGTFDINGKPQDTFLHMKDWTKGVVFINGHNLGRYWKIGPQETMYLPSPWLREGTNELVIFELDKCEAPRVSFVKEARTIGGIDYRY